jgi:hypothetical protein
LKNWCNVPVKDDEELGEVLRYGIGNVGDVALNQPALARPEEVLGGGGEGCQAAGGEVQPAGRS